MKTYIFFFSLMILVSCSVQRKKYTARVASENAKMLIHKETSELDSIQNILSIINTEHFIDSALDCDMQRILNKLNENLNGALHTALAIENAVKSRVSFRKELHSFGMAEVVILDSFNVARKKREEVYSMLSEAVTISTYKPFSLAAFFAPGVYKVPESATNSIKSNFTPVIDSVSNVANKYTGIEREIKIVFVGYSDAEPVVESSSLYKNIVRILHNEHPSHEEMNLLLSAFRAKEVLMSIKYLLNSQVYKFKDFNHLKISYTSYGKGEEYPSPTITNYKLADERRRIVLGYWTVLPCSINN
jgi:hypothetical protein